MTGAYVKNLRAALGLSPREFADLLATNLTTVYRWESLGAKELPTIGIAQRQLFVLIGTPTKADAQRIRLALQRHGWQTAWNYLTSRTRADAAL
jgi:transcriptional regulator with XRE-family HTH domain